MAFYSRRRRARRRLASVAFLSSISFDGNAPDNNFGTLIKREGDVKRLAKSNKLTNRHDIHRSSQTALDSDGLESDNGSESEHGSRNGEYQPFKVVPSGVPNFYDYNERDRRTRLSSESSRISTRSKNRDDESGVWAQSLTRSPDLVSSRPPAREKVRNKRIIFTIGKRAPIAILSSLTRIHHSSFLSSSAENSSSRPVTSNQSNVVTSPHKSVIVDSVSNKTHNHSHNHHRRQPANHNMQHSVGISNGSNNQHHHHHHHHHRQQTQTSSSQFNNNNNAVDPSDLFALMGLVKPSNQDISYGAIFLRPSRQSPAPALGLWNREGTPTGCRALDCSNPLKSRPQSHYSTAVALNLRNNCGCYRKARVYDSDPNNHNLSLARAQTNSFNNNNENNRSPYEIQYHANLLDDSNLVAGKYSTVLAFPSYITSIIDHVKPTDVKRELNARFRAKFPNLQLTLTKLRSIKREMYQIGRTELQLDYLVVAQAYVYFEKLCLKSLITKQNRKLCAGASLLLSSKLNDIRGPELKSLIEHIETSFRLKRRDIITMEFGVIVALEFKLHLHPTEILPHLERLIVEA